MNRAAAIGSAIAVDALLGDPRSLPHPVSAIAKSAAACEFRLRFPEQSAARQRLAGALAWSVVVAGTAFVTWVSRKSARRLHPRCADIVTVTILASTLSFRSLIDHVMTVVQALENADILEARRSLQRIVGRETAVLDAHEICRATIETIAESTCDGIVAPLMYAMLGGSVGAMTYKAVNTLDSLFGHIEPPYRYFGWASARADDLANFLPARISALAIVCAAQILDGAGKQAWETFRMDRFRHASPNAGQSEAAMAGALGVRLGGTNTYDGAEVSTPYLGSVFPAPDVQDVRRAIQICIGATVLSCGAVLAASWFWREA